MTFKKLIFIGFLGLLSGNLNAQSLPIEVLAEKVTHVGFAPPEHAGIYKFQILTTGEVQKIDNKNIVTVLAKLQDVEISKIKSAINSIKSDEIKAPQGPKCFDAPSFAVQVRQSSGVNMLIWTQVACRDSEPADFVAARVASLINSLENSFSKINGLLY